MKRGHRGASLVELLVGIAVGLFIVATTSFATSNQLNDQRRLMLETQLEQELRAAAEVVARDLRRAGYWHDAPAQIASAGEDANAFATVVAADANSPGTSISYAYSHRAEGADDTVASDERTGVKLEGGVLKLLLGDGGWQAMTDPNTVTITAFRIGLNTQQVPLADYCASPCPAGSTTCPPVQEVRDVRIELTGAAARAPGVTRSFSTQVRLRNDRFVGRCPA